MRSSFSTNACSLSRSVFGLLGPGSTTVERVFDLLRPNIRTMASMTDTVLTDRQREILQVIEQHMREHGLPALGP